MENNNLNRRKFLTLGTMATGTLALSPLIACTSGTSSKTSENQENKRKKTLSKRKLGKLEVSAIGYGILPAINFYGGKKKDPELMKKIIHTAYENGVNFFDTAEVYGPHYGEELLGDAVKDFRKDIILATKFGFDVSEDGQNRGGTNSRPEHIKWAVERMLKRLNTDRIDLLYQHRVDPRVPIEDVAGAVKDLMQEGKVLHWGLSEAGLNTIRRAHAELPLTAIQDEYSLWTRDHEQGSIALCEELGIGFVPWCPLGYGFLAGAINENSCFKEGDFRVILPRTTPENLPQNMNLVRFIKEWGLRKNAVPSQIALAWLLAQKPFIVPIPGTSQLVHLKENLRADQIHFSKEEITEFNNGLSQIQIAGNRNADIIMAGMGVEAIDK